MVCWALQDSVFLGQTLHSALLYVGWAGAIFVILSFVACGVAKTPYYGSTLSWLIFRLLYYFPFILFNLLRFLTVRIETFIFCQQPSKASGFVASETYIHKSLSSKKELL